MSKYDEQKNNIKLGFVFDFSRKELTWNQFVNLRSMIVNIPFAVKKLTARKIKAKYWMVSMVLSFIVSR